MPVRAAPGLTVDQERDRHWADSARVGDWNKYESAVGARNGHSRIVRDIGPDQVWASEADWMSFVARDRPS